MGDSGLKVNFYCLVLRENMDSANCKGVDCNLDAGNGIGMSEAAARLYRDNLALGAFCIVRRGKDNRRRNRKRWTEASSGWNKEALK